MKLSKSIPKISTKTFKNDCGDYYRENNFPTRMPEIPLTKFSPDVDIFQVQPYPVCPKKKLKTKNRTKTINDLSNWYNAHLSKMQFIKTYKTVIQQRGIENFGNYTYRLSKHTKPSAQYMHEWKVTEPHTDFKNYVDSVKSRHRDTYIPENSQWQKYFEHTIPRFHDKEEVHHEMSRLKDKYYEKIDGFRKSNVDTDHIKDEVLTQIIKEQMQPELKSSRQIPLEARLGSRIGSSVKFDATTEYGKQILKKYRKSAAALFESSQMKEEEKDETNVTTFEPHITHSGTVVVQTIEPQKRSSQKKIALQKLPEIYNISPRESFKEHSGEMYHRTSQSLFSPEKQVKNYLLTSPLVPYERMGTIANEILFDNVFDKYIPPSHYVKPKEIVKLVKEKPKEPIVVKRRSTKLKKNIKNIDNSSIIPPMTPMTPSFLTLTNDLQTFKKKDNLRKPRSKMLIVGKKKRKNAKSCDESLCDLTTNRNKINRRPSAGKILVVDPSGKRRNNNKEREMSSITSEDRIHSSLVNSIFNALRNSKDLTRQSFKRH